MRRAGGKIKRPLGRGKRIKGVFRADEPLKRHTTFRIGGPAKFFSEPRDAGDLKQLLGLAKKNKLRVLILGSGSNILAADEVVNALVVRLSSPGFRKISAKGKKILVGGGCPLSKVVALAQARGLSGAEFLSGIPGTAGGALVMNAGEGRTGKWISGLVERIRVMDYGGRVKALRKDEIKFGYRHSGLGRYIILSASLVLEKGNRKEIRERVKDHQARRKATQATGLPNAGCVFKNPLDHPAAKLIDECGLKGKRVGGACVSAKHANFILNTGKAQAAEVLRLMELIKQKVNQKFSIALKPEIKIWR